MMQRMQDGMAIYKRHSKQAREFTEWQRIAARNASLQLFHFSKTLTAIDGFWATSVPALKRQD
jgi:hypothetical protein